VPPESSHEQLCPPLNRDKAIPLDDESIVPPLERQLVVIEQALGAFSQSDPELVGLVDDELLDFGRLLVDKRSELVGLALDIRLELVALTADECVQPGRLSGDVCTEAALDIDSLLW
jgi:hypothetical protein